MPARIDIPDSRIRIALQKSSGHHAQAAKLLGISPRTLTRRLRANPQLRLSPLTMDDHLDNALRRMLFEGALRGDLQFQKLFLETFDPDGWGLKAPTPELMDGQSLREFAKRLFSFPIYNMTLR